MIYTTMKKRTTFLLILSFIGILPLTAQNKFDGLWGGKIISRGLEVDVNFEVKTESNRVLLSVPSQKINDQVGSGLSIKGDSIFFDYGNFNASYRGVYDGANEEILGEWTQGKSTTLNLKKVSEKAKVLRPQTPKPPYPYESENIRFHNTEADLKLAGTITIPKGEGPFPMAILVSGSGPQDRNSEILDHRPFHVIADHLTRNGIAVLRYDDRGVKNSEGFFSKSTSADFATDAAAAVAYAHTLDKVNPEKIGIIGHSEGGLIAPKVAADYENLDFIVSIAGPAVPITELMALQNKLIFEKLGMTAEGGQTMQEKLPIIYSIVNQDKEPKELFDTLIQEVKRMYNSLSEEDQQLLGKNSSAYYTAISSSLFTPWFRYFLAYDPGPSWQKVTCPVLAINGSEDIQVDADQNLTAIQKNLDIAENENYRIEKLEGFNHLMQECKTCSIREYALIETTFAPSVLELITEFIQGLE